MRFSEPSNPQADRSALSRRTLIKRGGFLAGGAALLSAAPSALAASETLKLDVACDGGTLKINRSNDVELDAPVRRGDPFIVQGRIYPEGTIEQGLSGPHQEGSIGQWICRGWFYYGIDEIAGGAVPHLVTTQLYLLDNFDGLVTDGMEGGITVVRAITGGYGRYAGARGQVTEAEVGGNDTTLDFGGGITMPAFNIQFEFQIQT